MDLSQLKYFKAVAECGKIKDAAETLFVSAPAVSLAISRLEGELGTKLFTRTNNKVILNKQGEILLRHTVRIFESLSHAKSEIKDSLMHFGRHVSIASFASVQWVDMVTSFAQEHPDITLSFTNLKRSELENTGLPLRYSFLLASDGDIPQSFEGELESAILFRDIPMLMVNGEHPLASLCEVELSALSGETVFLPMADFTLHDELASLYSEAGLAFPMGNAYSHLASREMVAAGLGVGFTSEYTVRSPALNLKYIKIKNARTYCSSLYWRKGHEFNEDELIFKSFIEEYYKKN